MDSEVRWVKLPELELLALALLFAEDVPTNWYQLAPDSSEDTDEPAEEDETEWTNY